MKFIKKIFIILGNYLPPPLNKYFYYFSGVKFKKIRKTWIGINCHLDNYDPSLIEIGENVCISYKCIFITHFDPTKSIKNHLIKKYKKKIIIQNDVFIGAGSIICPDVILKKNCFISSGSLVNKTVDEFKVVSGNPSKEIGDLRLLSKKINDSNK